MGVRDQDIVEKQATKRYEGIATRYRAVQSNRTITARGGAGPGMRAGSKRNEADSELTRCTMCMHEQNASKKVPRCAKCVFRVLRAFSRRRPSPSHCRRAPPLARPQYPYQRRYPLLRPRLPLQHPQTPLLPSAHAPGAQA